MPYGAGLCTTLSLGTCYRMDPQGDSPAKKIKIWTAQDATADNPAAIAGLLGLTELQVRVTVVQASKMSKRAADTDSPEVPRKGGDRPEAMDIDDKTNEMGEFEDEFEDEFESEDEIIEAGVDGRPDAEREADEKEGESA